MWRKVSNLILWAALLTGGLSAQITIIPPSSGGGGSSVDRVCFEMDRYMLPATDPASFTYDNVSNELKWPTVSLSIGDEVQFKRTLEHALGTDPQCSFQWYFASGGPTTNNVSFSCSLSCVGDGDSAIAQAFDTANASGDITVPGTAGLTSIDAWDISNDDSCTQGDSLVLQLERTTPSGTSAGTDEVYAKDLCITWTP